MNLQPLPNWIKSDPSRIPRYLWPLVNMLFFWHRRLFRQFISLAAKKGSIAFMDGVNLDAFQQHLTADLDNPILLPILIDLPPADGSNLQLHASGAGGLPARFVWLGRIDEGFKLFALQRALLDVSDWSIASGQTAVKFDIIGNGPGVKQLNQWLETVSLQIEVQQLGTRSGAALDKAMQCQDVLIAMGTAALEGGVRSIPTLVTGFSYIPIQKNGQYNWLFNQRNFDLGRNVQDGIYCPSSAHLPELLLTYDRGQYGIDCRTYVINNHSLAKQWNHVVAALTGSRLEIADYAASMRPGWFKK